MSLAPGVNVANKSSANWPGYNVTFMSIERRMYGFMTDVWPDSERPGLIVNSIENTKCPGLCETSLAMLLIAVELNTDVSGV